MDGKADDIKKRNSITGVFYGTIAYTAWGFLSIFWKLLGEIPSDEILAHRIFWSFVFVWGVFLFKKNDIGVIKEKLKDRKDIRNILLGSIFVTCNWGLYIWAVNSGNILQSSMGYYINPIMIVILGMTVFKERLSVYQYISIGFAAIGVIIMTVQFARIPWLSLLLAGSFALYGVFKKLVNVEPLTGMVLETTAIMPLALAFILFKLISGQSALYSVSLSTIIILLCSGVVTALPLLWFSIGTTRIKFSTMGFLQYLSPTIALFIGVFIYGEEFTRTHLWSFCFIWIGLIVYTFSNIGAIGKTQSKNRISLK